MKIQPGEVHICGRRRGAQPAKDHSKPFRVLGLNAGLRASGKKLFQALMLEPENHPAECNLAGDALPDGLIARGDYEHEFTLHQFTILPGGAAEKFRISEFDKIKIA